MLDYGEWTTAQKMVLAVIAVAFIGDGLANQILSVSVPAMMKEFAVPRTAFASVTAIGLVGITVGTLVGGMIGDRIGRRAALGFAFLLIAFGAVIAAVIDTFAMLAPMRFLAGLGIGAAVPNATTLIAEFTPMYRRGRAVNFGLVSIPIGILLSGLLGALVLPHYGWRALFLLDGAVSASLALVLFFGVPESPRYLLRRPHRRAELLRLLHRLGFSVPADAVLIDSASLGTRAGYAALLEPALLRSVITIGVSFFFCFTAVYGVLNWIPTLLASRGFPLSVASASLSAWSVGGMTSAIICPILIERFGSLRAMMGFAMFGAVGAVVLSQLPLTPEAGVTVLMIPLALEGILLSSLTGALYALAAHVFPPDVRASGVGAVGALGRAGAIASSFTAVIMMEFHNGRMLFIFTAMMLVLAGLLLLLVHNHIPRDSDIRKRGLH